MKRFLVILGIISLVASGRARNEIDFELSVSLLDPYHKIAQGFYGSYWPSFLQGKSLALGAGIAIHISSQFTYTTTVPVQISATDTSKWYQFDERWVQITNFEFFLDSRFQWWGKEEASRWKGWLTLCGGAIVNSGQKSAYRTQYEEMLNTLEVATLSRFLMNYPNIYRTEAYISPGILIGRGNFYFGYRHWFILDPIAIQKGDPARMVGTLRIGYRFKW